MKVRRFVMKVVDWHVVEVIDLLKNEVVQTVSHEWRAERVIKDLESKARQADEPTVIERFCF